MVWGSMNPPNPGKFRNQNQTWFKDYQFSMGVCERALSAISRSAISRSMRGAESESLATRPPQVALDGGLTLTK